MALLNISIACALAAAICVGGGCSSRDDGRATSQQPRVRVESGELVGTVVSSITSGRPLYSFLGVPYAEPPVHENRFKVRIRACAGFFSFFFSVCLDSERSTRKTRTCVKRTSRAAKKSIKIRKR